jgi:hypothetical protein
VLVSIRYEEDEDDACMHVCVHHLTWLSLLTLSTLSSRNWAVLAKDTDGLWLPIVLVVLVVLLLGSSVDEMMSMAESLHTVL